MAPEWLSEKISDLKYDHIIDSFEALDLEILKIVKFHDFMNTLRNFAQSVFACIFAKFKYFAKQFI